MPNTLVPTLKEKPLFRTISFGEDGAYFWKEMANAESRGAYYVSAATAISYPKVKAIYDSDEGINWVAFGSDGAYVINTSSGLISSDPTMTRTYTRDGASSIVPLRCASFGPEGVWVAVEDDGEVRSKGLPKNVSEAFLRKEVRKIELSPFSATTYFVEYTDGTTDWCLPVDWHPQVHDIEKLSIRIDERADAETDLAQKIVFAFGPENDTYFITNKGRRAWRGCSEDLATSLREPGPPSAVSMGEGGAFFWRRGTNYLVSAEAEMAYPEVWKIWERDEEINWVAFGPEGYYIVDTPQRIYASRQDQILRVYKENGNQVPIRCASFGWGGSWVIIEDDGVVRSHQLEPIVLEALLQGSVRHVALSWISPTHFYIEYMDQTSDWHLPPSWHSKVSDIEGNLPTPASKVKRLEKLAVGSSEFNGIEYQFNVSWRHTEKKCSKIKYIYKIVLIAAIWDQYEQYRTKVGNEQQLFHCTFRRCTIGNNGNDIELCLIKGCGLCAIMRTSYSVSKARVTGKFGLGIYTSATSAKAAYYAKNHTQSSCKAMLLNKVALGRACFTDVEDKGRTAPPPGYHSVCRIPGDALQYDETVVYDDDAIRPQYLIIYEEC